LTLAGSPLRAFQWDQKWSSYVAPKLLKGGRGSKNAKRPITRWNRTSLEKVCYKISLCENCQRQSCKAFIGLTIRRIRAKIIGGGDPSTWNFESKWPRWSKIAEFV